MINFLSSWVKNLSLALIVVSILEMILPSNKTKKYVKMVMGLYILFSIISPFMENSDIIDLNNLKFDTYIEEISKTSSTTTEVNKNSMENRLNEIYIEQLEEDITQKIQEKGYEIETCKVKAHISKDNSEIELINLKIKAKTQTSKEEENSIESKIVTEIQKIQKVEIGNAGQNKNSKDTENSNITKTDIKIIKDFLISEYGVNENCLKIN